MSGRSISSWLMEIKRFRLFAGPNGSGKTTLINQISHQFTLGYFINADIIKEELVQKNYLDCARYFPSTIIQSDWIQYLKVHHNDERIVSLKFEGIAFKEGFIIPNQEINSYHASVIADFFREKLLSEKLTFSYETVLSHPSKISYIREAKVRLFKTYLYFICTKDPEINKKRIKNRVEEGGHDVWVQKIEQRYYRSLELLHSAFQLADRAFIIDNSEENNQVIVEKAHGEVFIYRDEVPEWVDLYLLKKLKVT